MFKVVEIGEGRGQGGDDNFRFGHNSETSRRIARINPLSSEISQIRVM